MIDINDSDFKLMKMIVSLLNRENSQNIIDNNNLNKFKELALKIDQENYLSYLNRLKEYHHNIPLGQELDELEKLENAYNALQEMQCKFRNIYAKFSSETLSLSPMDDIDIKNIMARKNLVSGYLINLKNIEDCENKLENDSKKLIVENKKSDANKRMYEHLEEKLKTSFLRAEGRINENLDYTSVLIEYKENGFDIKQMLEDSNLLNDTYRKVEKVRKEKDELLETGNICYENDPSLENKKVLNELTKEAYKARYQLILIRIAMLINETVKKYDELLEKRRNLLELIKSRKQCLYRFKDKIRIDPFDRIRIQSQIDYINNLTDNSKTITSLRKEINDLTTKLDDLKNNNSKFLKEINIYHEFYHEKITVPKAAEEPLIILPNQVISLKDAQLEKSDRIIKEQTKTLAKTVLDSYNKPKEDISTNPQLVVEKKDLEEEKYYDIFPEKKEDNIFTVSSIEESIQKDLAPVINPEFVAESIPNQPTNDTSNQLFQDNVNNPTESIQEGTAPVLNPEFVAESIPNQPTNDTSNQLFQDNANNPFEEPYIYSNMSSDYEDIFPNGGEQEEPVTLPTAFWESESKTQPEEANKDMDLSIDEQIKKLKLVA